MMSFWLIAAGLTLLTLLILILPVIRFRKTTDSNDRQQQNIDIARDKKAELERQLADQELSQEEFDSNLLDLETALAIDLEKNESTGGDTQGRWAVWLLLVMIPLVSALLYSKFGEYRVIGNPALAEARAPEAENPHANLTPVQMVDVIKERLSQNPDDAQSWFALGRTMMMLKNYDEAVTAYRRTYDLVGDEAVVLFALADAMTMQKQGLLQGEPEQLILRGLEISPQNPSGLWLAGLAAEQRNDLKAAYDYWTRLLPLVANDPRSDQEVRGLIDSIRARDDSLPSPDTMVTTAVEAREIAVSVDVSAEMRKMASPDDIVFVYAKAQQGPPMPLAVKRLKVSDLPTSVVLSDNDAMIPAMKLSVFDQVVVGARISKSGNPVAQPGDLFAEVANIDSSNPPSGLSLSINQVK